MENPFEAIERRLSNIEDLLLDLKHKPVKSSSQEVTPYGDFKWLCATCSGIPASTLRIKSAAKDIPGVVKFGKRVLYEKKAVLSWLRSQTHQSINADAIQQSVSEQFSKQLTKRGGAAA